MRRLSFCFLVFVFGCDDSTPAESPREEQTSESETASPSSEDPTSSAEDEPHSDEPPRHRLTAAQGETLRAEIAAARRLADNPDRALAAFERLIEAHPTNAQLHCEAGFLAHRIGNDDRGHRLVATGIRLFGDVSVIPAELHDSVAMCLYNQGVIAQAKGRASDARASFRQSLALRPNDTVERRLAALPEAERVAVIPANDEESLATALHEDFREHPTIANAEGSRFSVETLTQRPAADGVPTLAVLKVAHSFTDGAFNESATEYRGMASVTTDAGYQLFPIFSHIEWGHDDFVLDGAAVEVVDTEAGPLGRFSAHVAYGTGGDSCGGTCCYTWHSSVERRLVTICTLDDLQCGSIELSRQARGNRVFSTCEDENDLDDFMPPNESWSRTLTVDRDRTTHLRIVTGAPSAPTPGARPLQELFRLL